MARCTKYSFLVILVLLAACAPRAATPDSQRGFGPSFEEIFENRDTLNAAQWYQYVHSLLGKYVRWTSTILDVKEDGTVDFIMATRESKINDLGMRLPTTYWVKGVRVPKERILDFKKHQEVTFEGKIQYIDAIDRMCYVIITLENGVVLTADQDSTMPSDDSPASNLLTLGELCSAFESVTTAQQESLLKELVGQRVRGAGEVLGVEDDGETSIHCECPELMSVRMYSVILLKPKTALEHYRRQHVIFEGDIQKTELDSIGDLKITLQNAIILSVE